jgi:hypothetical protein
MPMLYSFTCPHCGTSTGAVDRLPDSWFSVNMPNEEGGGAQTEYFDTWNCLSVYAGEHNPVE